MAAAEAAYSSAMTQLQARQQSAAEQQPGPGETLRPATAAAESLPGILAEGHGQLQVRRVGDSARGSPPPFLGVAPASHLPRRCPLGLQSRALRFTAAAAAAAAATPSLSHVQATLKQLGEGLRSLWQEYQRSTKDVSVMVATVRHGAGGGGHSTASGVLTH